MSTRATYQFNSSHHPSVTVYLHEDGHPQGAAAHVADALALGPLGAETFLRANPKAQITGGHNAHGDTEYRYTFTGDEVTCWPCGASALQAGFYMPIAEFVAKYAPGPLQQFQRWLTDRMAWHTTGAQGSGDPQGHARRLDLYRAAAEALQEFVQEVQP